MPSPESSRAQMQPQSPKPGAEKPSEKSQAELREALHEKFKSEKAVFDDAMADYKEALKNGTFEDVGGEPAGAGERRKATLQREIRGYMERAERMSDALRSSEPVSEELLKSFENRPRVDYLAFAEDIDPSKAGEDWQLNPESTHPDFETAKPRVIDLPGFVGKPFYEVFQHVLDTYGDTHYIPGKEYIDWLYACGDKTPAVIRQWSPEFYFPGSLRRRDDGHWDVRAGQWGGHKWYRRQSWLINIWEAHHRVVILEK